MKEHILLVDDDPAILHLFGLILEKAGYAVSQAKDGEEALKRNGNGFPISRDRILHVLWISTKWKHYEPLKFPHTSGKAWGMGAD